MNTDTANILQPSLKKIMRLSVEVGKPITLENGPSGIRKQIPILGGSFKGESFQGKILPGGADNLLIRPDGCSEINACYCLQTDSGAILYIQDKGKRHGPKEVMLQLAEGKEIDPSQYYFRTNMSIETGSNELAWLNKQLFIGTGGRFQSCVVTDIYQVL